ncbi:MAG: PhoH family protein [Nitrospirota bacterium]|nr:PhoH family protein [Nitrospirota bacterium]
MFRKRRGQTVKLELDLGEEKDLSSLHGRIDRTLKVMENTLGIQASIRGNKIFLHGDRKSVNKAEKFIREFYSINSNGYTINPEDIQYALKALEYAEEGEAPKPSGTRHPVTTTAKSGAAEPLKDFFLSNIPVSSKKKFIVPRTETQKKYIDAIKQYDMVIGIGPAGTGKTYLAMAMAISALLKKEVSRIILARPAVEAGEKLGFLPGDLYEKVNPYLRPLYDALFDMMETEKAHQLIEKGVIEIAPLAFMRGRTLNDSFIILDEAQNTTSEQMKMYLTRLGFNSKTVITGDITQVDLPAGKTSGLKEAEKVLKGIKDLHFVYFSEKDVVRHKLVQEIIKAYERFEKGRNNKL